MLEFTAAGSPRAVADRIEQCAVAQGNISALVVPWESDRRTLSMSVTAVKGEGWAIEHTNLGTIQLTDLGGELTRVAISGARPDHPETQKLAALFDRFAQQLQHQVEASTRAGEQQ
jgi:hypothetical protein